MRLPAALLALPLLAGSAAGVVLVNAAPAHWAAAAAWTGVLAVLAGAAFFAEREPAGVVTAILLGGLTSGYAAGFAHARELYRPALLEVVEGSGSAGEEPVLIEGVLREDAVPGSTLLHIHVRQVLRPDGSRVDAHGGVRLFLAGAPVHDASRAWRAGRTLRLPALLRIPGAFANPGVDDDRRALARRGIVLTGTVKSAALIEVVGQGSALEEWAARTRAWVRERIHRHVGPYDARSAAVAIAILIGDRTGLSEEDERRLQDAGTYHVIAISGGNIAILTALLLGTLRLLRAPVRTAAAATAVVLLFYGEVAGGTASVERAISAALVFLTALMLDHRGAALNTLAAAAVLGCARSPVAVLDAGFLLSFGATAGIILGSRRLLVALSRGESLTGSSGWRPLHAIAGVIAATLCAEIALAPVTASFFSRVTFAGVALNLAAIPLMTLVQCGSLLVLAASAHAPSADLLGAAVHWAAFGLVESSRLVDWVPWIARDVAPPALWLCAAYYACALGTLLLVRGRRAAQVGLAAAAVLMLAGHPATVRDAVPPAGQGMLRLVVLDVGQGDSILMMAPEGHNLLVDAGGLAGTRFDIASRVVLPSLRALGVRRLHALVLTHPDPDHAGGAAGLLRQLRPDSVWEGVEVPPHAGRRELLELAARSGVVWRTVRPGDVARFGPVDVRVHHPPEPDWERQRVRNDDSVVLEIRYGQVAILLPGDIGHEVERALIPRLDLPPVVILKAAHHGSATSSSEPFIDRVRPRAVIFSAGRNNRFGHPAEPVVHRYASGGLQMFNTAHDGAVFVETDGHSVEVRGWASGRGVRYRATDPVRWSTTGR